VEKAAKNFGGARQNDKFNFVMEPEAAAFSLLGYEFHDQFKVRDSQLFSIPDGVVRVCS
jgi:hypothetical protein